MSPIHSQLKRCPLTCGAVCEDCRIFKRWSLIRGNESLGVSLEAIQLFPFFYSLSASWLWIQSDLSGCLFSLPCWPPCRRLPPLWWNVSSGAVNQINPFSLKLLLSECFYHSNGKMNKTHIVPLATCASVIYISYLSQQYNLSYQDNAICPTAPLCAYSTISLLL